MECNEWYREHHDADALPDLPVGRLCIYASRAERQLQRDFEIRRAFTVLRRRTAV